MRIVCLSDTHGQHSGVRLPEGDLLIHAGDLSARGTREEIISFLQWFSRLPHRYKVFTGGNHDFFLEKHPAIFRILVPDNCHYLEDSPVVIEGITIWGSPITPFFFDWAFNRHRGAAIQKHWDMIPPHTDILVTHGPPLGILDRTAKGVAVGCEHLQQKVGEIKPRLHVFGHIHEAAGMVQRAGTTFVNASYLNLQYRPTNSPTVVDYTQLLIEQR